MKYRVLRKGGHEAVTTTAASVDDAVRIFVLTVGGSDAFLDPEGVALSVLTVETLAEDDPGRHLPPLDSIEVRVAVEIKVSVEPIFHLFRAGDGSVTALVSAESSTRARSILEVDEWFADHELTIAQIDDDEQVVIVDEDDGPETRQASAWAASCPGWVIGSSEGF